MIHIENLSFRYKRRPFLFNGLSLSLEGGRIYGLLGLNGAGKTTLLKITMGLLFPKGGSCCVLGYESQKREPAMLADMLFVPEEFYAPEMTIGRYVDLYAPFYPAFSCRQFKEYMNLLELTDDQHFKSFSMGQKKKAILAFALAANTRVLLLDEPTNGLDIPSKTQFRRLLASVLTNDRCIIISTHQVRDLEKLIDAVLVLDNGQMILNKSVEELTKKLSFKTVPQLTGQELYTESCIEGYRIVTPNVEDEQTQIDLELLFNAATSNSKAINEIMS